VNRCIIDASVAVKWFFRDEILADRAEAVLRSRTSIVVPDYFYLEMSSVFSKMARKKMLTAEIARHMYKALRAFPARVIHAGTYAELAMDVSMDKHASYYDCLYVVPALITGIPLVTADKRLYNAFRETEMAYCVIWLENFT